MTRFVFSDLLPSNTKLSSPFLPFPSSASTLLHYLYLALIIPSILLNFGSICPCHFPAHSTCARIYRWQRLTRTRFPQDIEGTTIHREHLGTLRRVFLPGQIQDHLDRFVFPSSHSSHILAFVYLCFSFLLLPTSYFCSFCCVDCSLYILGLLSAFCCNSHL